jgi:hypothetical protein
MEAHGILALFPIAAGVGSAARSRNAAGNFLAGGGRSERSNAACGYSFT